MVYHKFNFQVSQSFLNKNHDFLTTKYKIIRYFSYVYTISSNLELRLLQRKCCVWIFYIFTTLLKQLGATACYIFKPYTQKKKVNNILKTKYQLKITSRLVNAYTQSVKISSIYDYIYFFFELQRKIKPISSKTDFSRNVCIFIAIFHQFFPIIKNSKNFF